MPDPLTPISGAAQPSHRLAFGPFVLDRAGAQLLRDGKALTIAPKALALLDYLAARAGALVTKDELLDHVWGHRFVSDSALKVAVNSLRAVLGDDARAPHWVHTVQRRGYRFADAVAFQAASGEPFSAAPGSASPAGDGPSAAPSPAPSAAPSAAQSARPPALPGNLPWVGTPLLGRAEEQARLHAALAGSRLVTVTGPGGVGKTRLALACASHQAPADGVWLLRLDALGAQDAVGPLLVRVLGLADGAAADADTLARTLAPMRLRLLLDNAEHLADALAPQVSAWLQHAPDLQVLVTSQRPLHLAGEHVLPVAPLAAPAAGDDATTIRHSPAVALLCHRIEAARPGWAPDQAQWHGLAEIARALDGLPLALELAAARVPLLGVEGVRQRLGERLRMLTQGAVDAPDRHKTLRAALVWSRSLLPPQAASLLDLCAVFVGGFTLEAVQAVARPVLPDLDEWALMDHLELLRDMALIVDAGTPATPLVPAPGSAQAEPMAQDWQAEPRLRLYDSVRLMGLEQLAADGAMAAACLAHIDWLRALFNLAEQVQLDLAEAVWLGKLEPEAANLAAGMSRALQAAQAATADEPVARVVDLLAASLPFLLRIGSRHQAKDWWQATQALLQRAAGTTAPGLPPLLEARLGVLQGGLATQGLLPLAEGIAALRRALPALRAHGERRRLLLALYMITLMQLMESGVAEAEPSLANLRELVGPQATVFERRLLPWAEAMLARRQGDLDTFGRFYLEMMAESERRGDRLELCKAAWGAAQALFLTGRVAESIGLYDRTVDELRGAGRLRANPLLIGQAACVRLSCDASAPTLQLAREAVALLRPGRQIAFSLGDALPWVAWRQGRVDDALRLHAWSETVARQRGERRGPLNARVRDALLAEFGGRPVPADAGLDDEEAVRLALGPA